MVEKDANQQIQSNNQCQDNVMQMQGKEASSALNGVLTEKVMTTTFDNGHLVNDGHITENVTAANSGQNGIVEEGEIEPMIEANYVQIGNPEEDGVVSVLGEQSRSMLKSEEKEKEKGLEILVGNLTDGESDGERNYMGMSHYHSDFEVDMKTNITQKAR